MLPRPDMQLAYLTDHEYLIDELARLHFEQWSYLRPGETLASRTSRLRNCCKGGLSTVVIGLLGDEICGSAMLVLHDLESCPELTPWLAGVYVKPQYRHRGFASTLVTRITEEARALHFSHLYLYTPSNTQLYERLGWSIFQHSSQQGTHVVVMSKALASRCAQANRTG
jgi:GNAT superfamily N-acetyltransferase